MASSSISAIITKMFIKRVIEKLNGFLGPVRPQGIVHSSSTGSTIGIVGCFRPPHASWTGCALQASDDGKIGKRCCIVALGIVIV